MSTFEPDLGSWRMCFSLRGSINVYNFMRHLPTMGVLWSSPRYGEDVEFSLIDVELGVIQINGWSGYP